MFEKFIIKIEKIISFIIKAVIFVLPLFFLPWSGEYFEFNKQFLLWLAMPLALLLWLIGPVMAGELRIKSNPLNIPLIIFLALTALSSAFSLDKFSSWFGYYGRFSDAWLGLLSLVIFYWLLLNTGAADSAKKIKQLLKLFIYSAAAVAIISILAMLGVVKTLAPDPFSILASPAFNPAGGSLLSLAVFLSVVAVLNAGLLFSGNLKTSEQVLFGIAWAAFLLVLALVNFSLSWIILLLGLGLVIIFRWLASGYSLKKMLNYYFLLPLALLLAASWFLIKPETNLAKIILGANLPQETALGFKPSVAVSREVIKKNSILGSGPGTFAQDFSLYRPAEFNQSPYWQVRFDKSASQILELAATSGLPAALSYFLIVSLMIYANIILFVKYLKNSLSFDRENYNLISAIFTVFILLFFAQLFFAANTVLNFSFWLFFGLSAAFWQARNQSLFKEKVIKLNESALFFRTARLALFFAAALWLALAVFEIKFYAADIFASRGANREKNLTLAVKLNPDRANYAIALAKFYLNRAKNQARGEQKDNNIIQADISRAIDTAKQAVVTAPNSVQTQETLGMIYRDIRPLTIGSEPWAVDSFSQALALEPTNPVLAAELAKAYLNVNDAEKAEKYFNLALNLKPDYYDAKFGLAKVYLKEKKDAEALNLLNELAQQSADPEIYYELGRYYYNHQEIDLAIDGFKRALTVFPNHANSLFSLGIAYEAKGLSGQALKYYGKVLELNPDNNNIKKKIETLNNIK